MAFIDVLCLLIFSLLSVTLGNECINYLNSWLPTKKDWVFGGEWGGKNNFYGKSRKSLCYVSLLMKHFFSLLLMYFLTASLFNPFNNTPSFFLAALTNV